MRISVDTDKLRHLSSRLSSESSNLSGVHKSVKSLIESLDWEVRQKAQVEETVDECLRLFNHLSTISSKLANFSKSKATTFKEIDQDVYFHRRLKGVRLPLTVTFPAITITKFLLNELREWVTGIRAPSVKINNSQGIEIHGFEKSLISNEGVVAFINEKIPEEHLDGLKDIEYRMEFHKGADADYGEVVGYVWIKEEEWEDYFNHYFKKEYPELYKTVIENENLTEEQAFRFTDTCQRDHKFRELVRKNKHGINVYITSELPVNGGMKGDITHEIGHNVFSHYLSNEKQDQWIVLSDSSTNKITDYASHGFWEDFAESYRVYVIDPERLRAECPDKYEWLERYVFNSNGT